LVAARRLDRLLDRLLYRELLHTFGTVSRCTAARIAAVVPGRLLYRRLLHTSVPLLHELVAAVQAA